jgi:hypothetical protein
VSGSFCPAFMWGHGLISPIFCSLMMPCFSVGLSQIIYAIYGAYLGLKTNLAKSELVLVGNVDNVARLAGILGCGVASLPLKYLGLHLGASYKAKHIWDGCVIEKIERRLASWKMLYLYLGGRITLINNTLSNLPTSCPYFPSL